MIQAIYGVSRAPHPMSTPFFVILSKARSNEVVTITFLMLERQERRSWHDIVTLDESWFYLRIDHELNWAQPDTEIPGRERRTAQSQKVMFTIICNPGGFHLGNILPKGFKFNASYYVTQILDLCPNGEELRLGAPIEN
jgi:predicted cupin superfamily sugar epimerase